MWGSPRTGRKEGQETEGGDRAKAQPRLRSGEPQLRGVAGVKGRVGPGYRPTWGWTLKSVQGWVLKKG